ncbi:MAG: hypothetical protein KJO69_06140, partial [Gammaproteobacteria bacterium]|nr:hypothetical protein [Gammaproteobacteria bacterium]
IKPFIYSAALEKGYTAASVVNDAPITKVDASNENIWRPKNSSGNYKGPTRLRKALTSSTNLVSIRLVNDITPRYAADYLAKMGFERSRLPAVSSIALGAPSFTPLELATSYAIFANGGFRVKSYFIERIEDANGNILFEHEPIKVCIKCEEILAEKAQNNQTQQGELSERQLAEQSLFQEIALEQGTSEALDTPEHTDAETTDTEAAATLLDVEAPLELWPELPIDEAKIAQRVINTENVYIIDSMMRDVIVRGTAAPTLRASNSPLLKRSDLAGKTGTTNEAKDAWFSGYNGDYVATAWVGNQKYTDPGLGINEFGGKAALPIWQGFMEVALADKPNNGLEQPEGLITAKIDPITGLLAPAGMRSAIFEIFRPAHLPEALKTDTVKDPFNRTQKKQTDLF